MWTETWPTDPGNYWFYGWRFWSKGYPPELYSAKVYRTLTGQMVYVVDGCTIHKAEGGRGMWHPVIVPDLPELHDPTFTPRP